MQTRIKDLPGEGFSFQYTEHKHPLPHHWHFVGGEVTPVTWPSAWKRDQARACFTRRRTVERALADLARAGLNPNTNTQGQR